MSFDLESRKRMVNLFFNIECLRLECAMIVGRDLSDDEVLAVIYDLANSSEGDAWLREHFARKEERRRKT